MSSTPLHRFFVYAPDKPDAYERRMQVRPQHLERAAGLVKEGHIRVGGGLLTPESIAPGATEADRKLIGSGMIVEAESIEAVRKTIEQDPYWKADVWDPEKLVILPILLATPLP